MARIRLLLAVVFCLGSSAASCAQPADSQDRGRLLYGTHCISCHAADIHWREKRLVSNWSTLKAQVMRWQKIAELKWSEGDIELVAAYLNATYYHFSTTEKIGLGPLKQDAKESQ